MENMQNDENLIKPIWGVRGSRLVEFYNLEFALLYTNIRDFIMAHMFDLHENGVDPEHLTHAQASALATGLINIERDRMGDLEEFFNLPYSFHGFGEDLRESEMWPDDDFDDQTLKAVYTQFIASIEVIGLFKRVGEKFNFDPNEQEFYYTEYVNMLTFEKDEPATLSATLENAVQNN